MKEAILKQKILSLRDIKYSRYNPETRTHEKKVNDLAASISKIGMLYPVLVNLKNILIDGHRRTAANRLLAKEVIQAFVYEGDNPDVAYAEINATQKRLKGFEQLQVWLKCPEAVGKKLADEISWAVDEFGRSTLTRIAEANQGMPLIRTAVFTALYLDIKTIDAVKWLLKWPRLHTVTELVRQNYSKSRFMTAITNGEALNLS